jgi:3-dehydroquinate dehydratase/shikimate dehydrogenase
VIREVVHSVYEDTAEAAEGRLRGAPPACGMVEIRADRLRAQDVAGLVARAGRPVLVTVRRRSAGEQGAILDAALAAGAAFVDVEWEGPLRSRADGPDASRVVLSHHGSPCDEAALCSLLDAMAGSRAARLKIVPRAARLGELGAVHAVLRRAAAAGRPLAAFALGPAGLASRVLALAWGSWATFGAAARGRESAEGQPTTEDLLDVYRVPSITASTRRFGIAGSPVGRSLSPALHAAGYRAAGLDAVYLPLETEDAAELAAVAGRGALLGVEGFGVTIPLKEAVAARCASLDGLAACGAVNTVKASPSWHGFNTDAPAALALVSARMAVAGARVAVAGAGGTARAIAAALVSAGARVTLFHRGGPRGESAARATGAAEGPWASLPAAAWDLLVQATPLGANGEEVLPAEALRGRMVLDAAYGSRPTPLVLAARARGLAVADGLDLLAGQAALQFEILTGHRLDGGVFTAAAAPYRTPAGS